MQGRNKGNVSEEVSFINTQNSGHNQISSEFRLQ